MKKWGHLSIHVVPFVYGLQNVKNGCLSWHQEDSISIGTFYSSTSKRSHCTLSEHGIVYRVWSYDLGDIVTWKLKKTANSAKN